ncbi:hypothetical protein WQ57_23440 [Mesobacillus campisalis]|uniref:Rod shape-determining protein MreD n=1 Tax=Mesobacillus campisalis TaxID=1408103 RepID=A0A0M2SL25_9BACI|nr:CBO0543 family protein [Mesobacillus campisalis]KKK33577.1 hypothetical protein WQ57_23440 [Mesobacillus campisalis]
MAFVYIVAALIAVFVWFMPKRLSRPEIYFLWIFVSYVEIVVDLTLGTILGLYHFAQDPEVSPEALFVKMIMAPLFGIVFANYMPEKWKSFIPYWLLWVVLSTFFEWLTIKSGYLTYKGWELWYSFLFYIIAIPIMRWNVRFIRRR